ncbi:hypothetical protein [Bartonella bovis]|nr:hypothetical protein [Bartonella bovis]
MLAGLSLITSHTKVYAKQQKCPMVDNSRGVGPIVCDRGETGMLTTTSSGRGGSSNEIKMDIDMSMHSNAEAAVTIKNGADIIATKKLKVKVTKWSGQKPVIKVDNKGKLMLKGEVEVDVTGVGMKKVIEVNNGGTLMLMGGRRLRWMGVGGVRGWSLRGRGGRGR